MFEDLIYFNKSDFERDLDIGRTAELIALAQLPSVYPQYNYEDVATIPSYYYKGDIIATDKETGNVYFIEVKNDGRIADTRNVLCEEYTRNNKGELKDGNMKNIDTFLYCVVSVSERKIYVISYKKLKEIYKERGRYMEIPHATQTTLCYLLPLTELEAAGGLLNTINY